MLKKVNLYLCMFGFYKTIINKMQVVLFGKITGENSTACGKLKRNRYIKKSKKALAFFKKIY